MRRARCHRRALLVLPIGRVLFLWGVSSAVRAAVIIRSPCSTRVPKRSADRVRSLCNQA